MLSATLVVGGANDPAAQYSTINAAVTAANPGDTIRVDAGTYHESVNVTKTLTFVANHRRGDVIVDPGAQGSGFNVQANDVRIFGFTVEDAQGNAGINLGRAFSGADIEGNVLEDNTFGLYLNSSGMDRTIIRHNAFLHNNAMGAASGNGIYSDQGVSNVRILDNFFTGQTNASMIFVGNGSTAQDQFNLDIRGNRMINDAAIILANVHDSTISHNVSIGSNGSAIFFAGGVHNVEVSHNVLRNGAFTGINLRFDPADYSVSTPDTNNIIRDNFISGFGDSGIRLREGASGNLVLDNHISGNGTNGDPTTGDGISLENAQNNVIRGNHVDNNRRDGIRVDATSTGNLIKGNHLRNNGEFDAFDASTGNGTAGTANTWINNKGQTANPPGLLVGQHHEHHHDHDDDGNDDQDDDNQGHGHHHRDDR
jgi:parallel beta-helix repeat protein